MSIFKAYDIRGIYNEDLTNDIAKKIGKAYTTLMNVDEVIVGRDCRNSSPFLSKSLIEGINEAGADVYEVGMVPGPVVEFYLAMNKKIGGVYVTASHNPPEYNGFKVMNGLQSLNPEEIQTIKKIIDGKNYRIGTGMVYHREILDKYTEFIEKNITAERLKIVIDSANGTCGPVAPGIFNDLGCYVTSLYAEPNGSFPNHYPDPTRAENLVEIKRRVIEEQAHLGIAFDGDGDRVVFIDEQGNALHGDQTLMLFARQILEKTKGKIIYTINCSRAVEEDIKAHGGTPVVSNIGHSFIKKKLADEDGLFAGEMSGHFFFKDDYFGYDDGIYAALRMAEIVSKGGKLSRLVADLPRYYASTEERLPCPENKKFEVVEALKREFSDYKQITIDGIRIEFEHGWGLIRASNTEPMLSLRFEADTEQERERIKGMLMAALKKFGVQ
jgi:phosphomannomutase/phosphoglucomutase